MEARDIGDRHDPQGRVEQAVHSAVEDARFARFRSRRSRRLLVVALGVVLLTGAVAVGLGWPWVLAVLLVVFVPVQGALNASTRGVTELPVHLLDEYQALARARAYAQAYRCVAVVLVVAALVAVPAARVLADPRPLLTALAVVVFGALLVAPSCTAAWNAVDEEEDDGLPWAATHHPNTPRRRRFGYPTRIAAVAVLGAVIGLLISFI